LECGDRTVARVRRRYTEGGLDAALYSKRPTGRQYRKLDGRQEAKLIALACSDPPGGRGRWTMKLLADRLVELAVVESIDPATVWRTLKKTTAAKLTGS
jgi:transposase